MVEQINPQADLSQLIREFSRGNLSIEKQNELLGNLIKQYNRYSAAGTKLEKSLKNQNTAGEVITRTWRRVDEQLKLVNITVSKNIQQLQQAANREQQRAESTARRLRQQIEREQIATLKHVDSIQKRAAANEKLRREQEKLIRVQARARSQARQLRRSIIEGTDFTGASPAQEQAFKRQVAQLTQLAQQHGLTAARINGLWARVARGNIQAYTGALGRAQDAIIRLQAQQAAFGTQQERVTKQTQELTLSWRSLTRLLAVQLAHRAISSLANALEQANRTAIELSIRIAEIRTIADEGLGFRRISDELKEISTSFGFDVLDVAEAEYQALSNQVVHAGESFSFLRTASELAIAGVTDITNSVQLLTAAINAFDRPVEEARQIAASFFKTVELGRLRIEDMAQILGRTAVPASQLGLDLEELQAAYAVATIRGVRFSEASTLIRNVLLKLIRPTDEMKRFFAELGVTSGEAAVQAFGFEGVLARLEERAQGSSTELGELFGRIRAITGAMIFANDGIEQFRENLKQIRNPVEDFDRAVTTVLEASGRKIRIQLNAITNTFITEFSEPLQKIAIGLIDSGVTGETIAKLLAATLKTILVPAIIATTAALVKLTLAALSNPFTALLAALSGVIGLVVAISQSFESLSERIEREVSEAIKQIEKLRQIEKENIEKNIQDQEDALNLQIRLYARAIAEIVQGYDRGGKDIAQTYKKLVESLVKENKRINTDLKEQVKEIVSEYEKLVSVIEKSQLKLTQLTFDLPQKLFELEIKNLNPTNQITQLNKRIAELRQSATDAAVSDDEVRFNSINNQLNRTVDLRETVVEKLRSEFGLTTGIFDIEKERAKILREEISNLELFIRKQVEQRESEVKNVTKQKETLAELTSLTEKVNKFKRKGILGAENIEDVKAIFNEQKSSILELIKLRQQLGLDESKNQKLRERGLILEADHANRIKQLRAQQFLQEIQQSKNRILATTKELEAEENKLTKFRNQTKEIIVNLRGSIQQLGLSNVSFLDLNKIGGGLSEAFDIPDFEIYLRRLEDLFGQSRQNLRQTLTEVATLQGAFIQLDKALTSDDNLKKSITLLEKVVSSFNKNAQRSEIQILQKSIESTLKALKEIEQGGSIELLNHVLERNRGILNSLSKDLQNLGIDQSSLLTFDQKFNEVADRFGSATKSFADSVQNLQRFLRSEQPQRRQFGGLVGTDSIQTALTPGEFVINQMATRRFLPQLLSINAGSQGDTTTNITGDFNISLASSGNTQTDVTAIGQELKNAIRQGRLKLV